jgi:hypothetical protein
LYRCFYTQTVNSFPYSLVDLPRSETPDQVVLLGCRELSDRGSGEVWRRIEVLYVG